MDKQKIEKYWAANLKILGPLLLIWALVSFGLSIFWVDHLDKIEFFGFKLGFWFAQQGSIFIYVLLIVVYVKLMNKVDASISKEDS